MQNVTSLFVWRAVVSYYFMILHMCLICHAFEEVLCHGLLQYWEASVRGGYYPRVLCHWGKQT